MAWRGRTGLGQRGRHLPAFSETHPGGPVPVTRVHSMGELTIRAGSSPLRVFPWHVLNENYLLCFLCKLFPSLSFSITFSLKLENLFNC